MGPGPNWSYPCGACKKPVKSNQLVWSIATCKVFRYKSHSIWTSPIHLVHAWICQECDVPNYSSSLIDVSSSSMETVQLVPTTLRITTYCGSSATPKTGRITNYYTPPGNPRIKAKYELRYLLVNFEHIIDKYNPRCDHGNWVLTYSDIKNGGIFTSQYLGKIDHPVHEEKVCLKLLNLTCSLLTNKSLTQIVSV